ncbi:hypothetical protein T281_16070 [Rhodomicrobium udaipurense JA643]|uniref:Uncharacterized protein n=1 Tax=Rhodomicrobium udaipurense TaxID=1202716 RepID=A0A8I1GEX4_9HYPH|nr:hypothetical protein [Rhodomicrobium udaipurense]KAI93548.1 hypothetical protein T281_16070 [Rhodomicrobium udaipurense JA643]MBJ7543293.1 hypothetical protein [Rhodomicrobium udaipurense]
MTVTVDLQGNWKDFAETLPPLAEGIGTVTVDGTPGALIRTEVGKRTVYAQLVGDQVTELDGRTIAGEMKRGKPLSKPKRITSQKVGLDTESLEIAIRLGAGNVSEGVRVALKMAAQKK